MPNNSPIITTIVGTGDAGFSGDNGPAIQASLREPFMCDFDTDGNLYVCEAKNHTVRKIDMVTKTITTVAGTGESGYTGDGGPATSATMNEPYSLWVMVLGIIIFLMLCFIISIHQKVIFNHH